MKKRLFVAISILTLLLGACGNDKKSTEEKAKIEETTIDLTQPAADYKTTVLADLTAFVEDVKLLQTHINDSKLKEASELYPLLHMNLEKFKPLQNQFLDQFTSLDGPTEEGKELEGKGLHAIEYGLFVQKDVSGLSSLVADLVEAATELANEVSKAELSGEKLLASTENMLQFVVSDKLTAKEKNIANTQVYDVKGNVDGVTQVMHAFQSNASKSTLETLEATLNTVNEEIAFYEVGKEDYVNFTYFTNKQKEQLLDQMNQLEEDFVAFKKSIK